MELVVRATVMYWFLWVIMRGTGRRELSELSAFDLILLVSMGDLIQQGVTQEDFSLTGAMIAVGTISLWVILSSYARFRSRRAERLLEGQPVIVVRDGQMVEAALHRHRLTSGDIEEAARQQGVADLSEVALGILETDGKFSFLKPGGDEPPRQPDTHRA